MPREPKPREKIDRPALKGKLVVDTFRGQVRVRAWPRKRGPAKDGALKRQQDWFRDVTQLIKYAPASQIIDAMEATKGTGLYPRDLLMRAIASGLVDLVTADGFFLQHRNRALEPVMWQGVINRLNADLNIPAGIGTVIPWPLPVLDTNAYWNVAAPTLYTIPAGVNIVQLFAGALENLNPNGRLLLQINHSTMGALADSWSGTGGTLSGAICTGPVVVNAGDTLSCSVLRTQAGRLSGTQGTFFGMTVLQAQP